MSTGLITRRALLRAASPSLSPLLAVLLVPLALPAPCRADAADELQTVVITATRLPTPLLEVASSVTPAARSGMNQWSCAAMKN